MPSKLTNTLYKNLKEFFGYDTFRGNQEAIINNILQNKNTFVSMPTGGGKSLCYQLPAIMQEGLAIIISPLIALMKDQVDQLQARGIKAALLNSTLSQKAVNITKQAVLDGHTKLLYIAPETLNKEEVLAFLKQVKISFIAVDEAHCISEWGHDFRPEYRNIKHAASQLGHVCIVALTATATPRVELDILNNLGITDVTVFRSSFNRPNLYYEVRFKEERANKQLIRIIKEQHQVIGIVYCQSRKQVDELTTLLNLNDIKAVPYHAGLDTHVRVKNQEDFLKKQYQVIVATIAFGMGIDTLDVQFVIHYDMPKSLEAYYQETGRAGRDNLKSTCLLLYAPEDFVRLERLNKSKMSGEREKVKILLDEMKDYIVSGVCRKKQLLYYFGETFGNHCDDCDNCKNPTDSYVATQYLQVVLEAVQQAKQQFDMEQIVQLIQGIHIHRIENHQHQQQHQNLPIFGKGAEQTESFWKSVTRQALIHDYLTRDVRHNETLQLTKQGQDFLKKKYEIIFVKDKIYEPAVSNKKTMDAKGYDENLFHLLHKLREKVAKEKGIPAYTVLQDSSLEELALVLPTTLEELTQVAGLSMSKATKFGTPFVQVIQKYVADNDIITSLDIVVKSKASRSKDKVYIIQQIDRKTDLAGIAMFKSQTMEELIDEIEAICYSGVKLNLNYYIDTILTPKEQQEIYNYFMQAKEDNIKQACKALGKNYNEEDIRLMRIKFLSEVAN